MTSPCRLRQHDQVSGLRAAHGRYGHAPVQGDQLTALFNGQRQQVRIRHLPGTQQPLPHQAIRLQQADGIRPEGVRGMLGGFR